MPEAVKPPSRRGSLFVISAPSGSGKTTLVQKLLANVKEVRFSISYTTRAVRGEEKDGVDYHFISRDEFLKKTNRGGFLEWAEVYGNLYGTGREETERVRNQGIDVLLDIDVQGAAQVRVAQADAVTIFIMPPSFEALAERLKGRNQDAPDVIASRLEAARKEIARYHEFDYVLVNEDVDSTAEELRAVVFAERSRPPLLKDRLRPILESFKLGEDESE